MGNFCQGENRQNQDISLNQIEEYAICIIEESGGSKVSGLVKIQQINITHCRIQAKINGLKSGLHGFHIHEFGNLTEGCKTAGPHFNPFKKTHGGPGKEERHLGDLGNIESKGESEPAVYDQEVEVQLFGENSIIGRSFVVHADQDDLGEGNNEESKKTGNAGARLGCGVIAYSGPLTFE